MSVPMDTVISFPLVTTPFELLHITIGVRERFPRTLPLQYNV